MSLNNTEEESSIRTRGTRSTKKLIKEKELTPLKRVEEDRFYQKDSKAPYSPGPITRAKSKGLDLPFSEEVSKSKRQPRSSTRKLNIEDSKTTRELARDNNNTSEQNPDSRCPHNSLRIVLRRSSVPMETVERDISEKVDSNEDNVNEKPCENKRTFVTEGAGDSIKVDMNNKTENEPVNENVAANNCDVRISIDHKAKHAAKVELKDDSKLSEDYVSEVISSNEELYTFRDTVVSKVGECNDATELKNITYCGPSIGGDTSLGDSCHLFEDILKQNCPDTPKGAAKKEQIKIHHYFERDNLHKCKVISGSEMKFSPLPTDSPKKYDTDNIKKSGNLDECLNNNRVEEGNKKNSANMSETKNISENQSNIKNENKLSEIMSPREFLKDVYIDSSTDATSSEQDINNDVNSRKSAASHKEIISSNHEESVPIVINNIISLPVLSRNHKENSPLIEITTKSNAVELDQIKRLSSNNSGNTDLETDKRGKQFNDIQVSDLAEINCTSREISAYNQQEQGETSGNILVQRKANLQNSDKNYELKNPVVMRSEKPNELLEDHLTGNSKPKNSENVTSIQVNNSETITKKITEEQQKDKFPDTDADEKKLNKSVKIDVPENGKHEENVEVGISRDECISEHDINSRCTTAAPTEIIVEIAKVSRSYCDQITNKAKEPDEIIQSKRSRNLLECVSADHQKQIDSGGIGTLGDDAEGKKENFDENMGQNKSLCKEVKSDAEEKNKGYLCLLVDESEEDILDKSKKVFGKIIEKESSAVYEIKKNCGNVSKKISYQIIADNMASDVEEDDISGKDFLEDEAEEDILHSNDADSDKNNGENMSNAAEEDKVVSGNESLVEVKEDNILRNFKNGSDDIGENISYAAEVHDSKGEYLTDSESEGKNILSVTGLASNENCIRYKALNADSMKGSVGNEVLSDGINNIFAKNSAGDNVSSEAVEAMLNDSYTDLGENNSENMSSGEVKDTTGEDFLDNDDAEEQCALENNEYSDNISDGENFSSEDEIISGKYFIHDEAEEECILENNEESSDNISDGENLSIEEVISGKYFICDEAEEECLLENNEQSSDNISDGENLVSEDEVISGKYFIDHEAEEEKMLANEKGIVGNNNEQSLPSNDEVEDDEANEIDKSEHSDIDGSEAERRLEITGGRKIYVENDYYTDSDGSVESFYFIELPSRANLIKKSSRSKTGISFRNHKSAVGQWTPKKIITVPPKNNVEIQTDSKNDNKNQESRYFKQLKSNNEKIDSSSENVSRKEKKVYHKGWAISVLNADGLTNKNNSRNFKNINSSNFRESVCGNEYNVPTSLSYVDNFSTNSSKWNMETLVGTSISNRFKSNSCSSKCNDVSKWSVQNMKIVSDNIVPENMKLDDEDILTSKKKRSRKMSGQSNQSKGQHLSKLAASDKIKSNIPNKISSSKSQAQIEFPKQVILKNKLKPIDEICDVSSIKSELSEGKKRKVTEETCKNFQFKNDSNELTYFELLPLRVLVGDIPKGSTSEDIRKIFSKNGFQDFKISSVFSYNKMRLVIATFPTKTSYKKALDSYGSITLQGKPLFIIQYQKNEIKENVSPVMDVQKEFNVKSCPKGNKQMKIEGLSKKSGKKQSTYNSNSYDVEKTTQANHNYQFSELTHENRENVQKCKINISEGKFGKRIREHVSARLELPEKKKRKIDKTCQEELKFSIKIKCLHKIRFTVENVKEALNAVGIKDVQNVRYITQNLAQVEFSSNKSVTRALGYSGQINFKGRPLIIIRKDKFPNPHLSTTIHGAKDESIKQSRLKKNNFDLAPDVQCTVKKNQILEGKCIKSNKFHLSLAPLPPRATRKSVKKFFNNSGYKDVEEVIIRREPNQLLSGIILFSEKKSYLRALKSENFLMDGSKVKVEVFHDIIFD